MSSAYYFASRSPGSTTEFAAIPEGAEYEAIPDGADADQLSTFYSRPVEGYSDIYQNSNVDGDDNSYIQQKVAPQIPGIDPPVGSLLLNRQVPMKVDPKHFFAVERTFFQWMHTSLWLLGASLTIISYSKNDPVKLLYGSIIMPVALSFTFYSLYQFRSRIIMLKVKSPGPYEDTRGPTILAIMLMTSILAQFAVRLFY